jgi:hypothetical protein
MLPGTILMFLGMSSLETAVASMLLRAWRRHDHVFYDQSPCAESSWILAIRPWRGKWGYKLLDLSLNTGRQASKTSERRPCTITEAATSLSKMQSAICDSLYTIQEIPGKGHGLVAATTIIKGTRILSESPLFRVPRGGNSKTHLRDSISKKVAVLREEQRQAFLSLHDSFEDEDGPELGRVRTNALPLRSDATTGGIFLDSSRINHSCNHNAQNTWNENLQKLTIHAIRDIAKGNEITIFYLTARRNRSARLHALQTNFRFT